MGNIRERSKKYIKNSLLREYQKEFIKIIIKGATMKNALHETKEFILIFLQSKICMGK